MVGIAGQVHAGRSAALATRGAAALSSDANLVVVACGVALSTVGLATVEIDTRSIALRETRLAVGLAAPSRAQVA